jgi:excisionase family DNA binding protein
MMVGMSISEQHPTHPRGDLHRQRAAPFGPRASGIESSGGAPAGLALVLAVPAEAVEQIARRAAAILAEHETPRAVPWLDTKGAAQYLSCGTDRIHDLVALRKLTPRRDGRRLLFRPADLDAYVEANR